MTKCGCNDCKLTPQDKESMHADYTIGNEGANVKICESLPVTAIV